jgi:hypothetical protein
MGVRFPERLPGDVGLSKREAGMGPERFYVPLSPGAQVVHALNPPAIRQEPFAQMRADETGSSSDQARSEIG